MNRLTPFLALLLLSGCVTSSKVNSWLDKNDKDVTEPVVSRYLMLNEAFASAYCADEFPVAESEVIPGEETVKESEETQTETVPCKDSEGRQVEYVEVPKVKVVTRTITRTDTIKVRDTAKEKSLQLQLVKADTAIARKDRAYTALAAKAQDYKQERNIFRWVAGGIAALLIIGVGFRILRAAKVV